MADGRCPAVFVVAVALLVGMLVLPVLAVADPAVPEAGKGRDGLEDIEMERLREALRGDEVLAQAWFRLGAGDAAGARSDIKRLLRDRPRDPNILHMLAIAASAERRGMEARRALRRSLRQRPDGWVALHLVNLLLNKGRVVAAQRVLGKLPDDLEDDPQVRRASAYVQVAGGNAIGLCPMPFQCSIYLR